jgi:hypothetical protein
MKIRLAFLFVTIIAIVSATFAFMCYSQLSNYDAKLQSFEVLYNELSAKYSSLHEEDLILLQKIDGQYKLIKAQDDKIRIQDAIIAEARARAKKK